MFDPIKQQIQLIRQLKWVRFFSMFRHRINHDRLPMLSGHLAYVSLLSCVPMLAVVFSIFTWWPRFAPMRRQLEVFIFSNLVPQTEIAFRYHFSLFVKNASKTTSVGLIMLLVVAILLIAAIDETLNHIWRTRGQRKRLKTWSMYLLILAAGPTLVGGSLFLSSYVKTQRWFDQACRIYWAIPQPSFCPIYCQLVALDCCISMCRRLACAGEMRARGLYWLQYYSNVQKVFFLITCNISVRISRFMVRWQAFPS